MTHQARAQFLASLTDAKDLTDLNIAAGIALEEIQPERYPRLKMIVAVVAAFLALTIIGDAFAASPIHPGISPIHTEHGLLNIPGAKDWGDDRHADVFGHDLPWRAHDGWMERLLGW